MLRKLHKFIDLDPYMRKLFIEAYTALGIARMQLQMKSFKQIVTSLDLNSVQSPVYNLPNHQLETARSIGSAIQLAAGNTPWESACLAQSLAAQKMMMKRGIPGILYLGVTQDVQNNEPLHAHAWLQCTDQFITGELGHERFKVLSTFSWQ